MVSRLLKRSLFIVAGILLLAGCSNPIVASVEPTPTPVPTPVPPPKPTFEVTKGSITDIVQATGRVVAVQQQDLYFRQAGNLDNIYVQLQDKVKKGQLLAALDSSTLKKQIAQQQAAVDAAKLNLQKAQTSTQLTTVGIDQQIKSDQAAVAGAQAALSAQQAKLAALTNPTAADVAKAQASVTTAQAALASAQLKLQALQAGPLPADAQKAASAVMTAQSTLNVAKEKLAVVQAGPQPADVAQAKAKLDAAQQEFNAAKATYDAFQAGPSQQDVQKAQLAVTQAKNALYAAQVQRDAACAKVAQGVGQAECNAQNAAVNTAQSNLDAANQALAQLGTPTTFDKAKANAAYQQAQADLAAAQAAYAAATAPANASDVAQAKEAVNQAQAALLAAQAAQAGLAPTKNQIAQAQQDVVSAQAGVDAARAGLQAILNPSPDVINQQQAAVAGAAANVAAAQGTLAKDQEIAKEGDTGQIDLAIYQKQVDEAQLALDSLNDQLSQMQIVAPFDGIIINSNGQPGDKVNAYTAVLTIADPSQLQIAVSVPQDQLSKVAMGQTANIVMDTFPGKNIAGKVTALPSVVLASSSQNDNSPGAQASAAQQAKGTVVDTSPKITPEWPGPGAQLGQLARVTITVQKKDDVLMIPTNTVNRINNRTFVLLDNNGRQQPVDIQIGIQTDQMTEVISGLTVGQKVYARGF